MSNELETKVVHEGGRGRYALFAFLGGAVAGAVAALLTAPASGAETRARLRATGERGLDKARHLPDALKAAGTAAEHAFVASLSDSQAGPRPEGARDGSHRPSAS